MLLDAPSREEISRPRRWNDVLGAWLGIGTAPGALIVGAGLASRYGGAAPLVSIIISFLAMFAVVWFPGTIGLKPPFGEGLNVSSLTPKYFKPGMQKVLAGLIALGMTGWFGFNVGLGGAALSALLGLPGFVGPILIGIPVLMLSLSGIRRWNGLATLTTIAVIILVFMITNRYSTGNFVISLKPGDFFLLVIDVATFVGYIAVFAVRSPDFTAGFASRKDLIISNLFLCVPITLITLAGVGLQQGTGSTDLVGILARPGGLPIGNLLIFLAVIAPSFTILFSGAPALKTAVGLNENVGMFAISIVGLVLAIARFDLFLINYLGVLAALFPPLVVPMAFESIRRRRGLSPSRISIWVWLPGALVSVVLTLLDRPLAALNGLIISVLVVIIHYFATDQTKEKPQTT
jgi:hypothetical protein